MNFKKLFFLLSLLATFFSSNGQNMYACFQNDADTSLKISIYFGSNSKAKSVLYKGGKSTIAITFLKRKIDPNPGGHPSSYWVDTYFEKNNGKINGTYTFTNAGTHNLDVTYKRKKDGKEFYFKIIEGSMDPDNSVFRKTPCFQ